MKEAYFCRQTTVAHCPPIAQSAFQTDPAVPSIEPSFKRYEFVTAAAVDAGGRKIRARKATSLISTRKFSWGRRGNGIGGRLRLTEWQKIGIAIR